MKFPLALFLLILISSVFAVQPTQQTSKIFLTPFYTNAFAANTNNSFSVTIAPPDGFTSTKSAIIVLDIWMSPTVTFTLWVNDRACNNPNYTISTTFSGAGQGRAYFDCSNQITRTGVYNIKIKSSSVTGASNAWLDHTYINNPSGQLLLHGTEYQKGDTAKIWLQLLDSQQRQIDNATCFTDSYYPDGETFLERELMDFEEDGIYYHNHFLADDMPEGVYPTIAICYYVTSTRPYVANASQIINGSDNTGSLSSTFTQNGVRWNIGEVNVSGTMRVNQSFNFSSLNQTNFTTDLVVYWIGIWNDNAGHVNITVFNYTSNSWIALPNTIPNQAGSQTVTNTLTFPLGTNLTTAGLISTKGNFTVRFEDNTEADTAIDQLQTDLLQVLLIDLSGGVWTETRGSSELHIRNATAVCNGTELVSQLNANTTTILNRINLIDANLSRFEANSYTNYSQIRDAVQLLQQQINANFTSTNNDINGNFTLIYSQLNNFEHSTDYNFSIVKISLANINSTLAGLSEVQANLYGNLTVINANLTTIHNNTVQILEILNMSNFNVSVALSLIQSKLDDIYLVVTDNNALIQAVQQDLNAGFTRLGLEIDYIYERIRSGVLGVL